MAHTARSARCPHQLARDANRLKLKRGRIALALARAVPDARTATVQRQYPHPPKYRYSYRDSKPVQPVCYGLS